MLVTDKNKKNPVPRACQISSILPNAEMQDREDMASHWAGSAGGKAGWFRLIQ
jgi:hypothetical protein